MYKTVPAQLLAVPWGAPCARQRGGVRRPSRPVWLRCRWALRGMSREGLFVWVCLFVWVVCLLVTLAPLTSFCSSCERSTTAEVLGLLLSTGHLGVCWARNPGRRAPCHGFSRAALTAPAPYSAPISFAPSI